MMSLTSVHGVGSAARRVALLAAMLILTAGTSQADRYGRGSGHGGGYGRGNGGGRVYGDGGGRTYAGRGGCAYRPVYKRGYSGGGRVYGGGRHFYGGGGYGGGGRLIYSSGGGSYCGGGSYYGSYGYRRAYPSTYVRVGIGLAAPHYSYSQSYSQYSEPYDSSPSVSIDVANEPPAGCYYYDSFCDEQFSNLDDYTEHVESHDHAKTIEIIQRDSGSRLRSLEFVGGYWSVQK